MSRWFRHYAGMMRDEKLVRAALKAKQPVERVVWLWGAILESAAELNDGGKYELDTAEAAYFLRADQADLDCIVECLSQLGRLHDGAVAKWGDRQFQSDVSTDRVRAHRGRGRESGNRERNGPSDECNVSGTALKRSGNTPETETEAKTEKKAPRATRAHDWPSDFQEQFWEAYPKKVDTQAANRKLDRIRKSDQVAWSVVHTAVKAYAQSVRGTEPKFIKSPEVWLNKGCYEDELPGRPADLGAPLTGDVAPGVIHVMRESEDWGWWSDAWRRRKGCDPPMDKKGGWCFPREWAGAESARTNGTQEAAE